MYWQEDEDTRTGPDLNEVVDLVFTIRCRAIPSDHAQALSREVVARLPWLAREAHCGLQTVHGAPSGNGWYRPDLDDRSALIHLSRRARLWLRMPRGRVADGVRLEGATLDVAGHELVVGDPTVRELNPLATLFCRYVVAPAEVQEPEEDFLAWAAAQLQAVQVPARKLMCGRSSTVGSDAGDLPVRSLMVADLSPEASLRLQRHGIGTHQAMGCGIFIPHKGIAPVSDAKGK
jgi:CRISPR-associated protein Cas6